MICDHVAGMTDTFAVREAEKLSRLNKMDTRDLHLQTVLGISSPQS
jgi:hypothetical protein